MILKQEIGEKAVLWSVPPDTVDKDWVLGHFLSAFFQVDNHKERLIFKGGTCLRKCRFPDYRFSEDLDFTSTDQEYRLTRELIMEAIQIAHEKSGVQFVLTELKDLVFKDKLAGYQSKIKYWGANHGKNQMPPASDRWLTSIKVEITLYEQREFPAENFSIYRFRGMSSAILFAFIYPDTQMTINQINCTASSKASIAYDRVLWPVLLFIILIKFQCLFYQINFNYTTSNSQKNVFIIKYSN
jgi:hypothetical protein